VVTSDLLEIASYHHLWSVSGGRDDGDMRGDILEGLRDIASWQAGVVSRQQALNAGTPCGSIASKLRSGRWQRLYPGVYALFTGPVPRLARLWAVVLWAGKDAVLSHESAAELHGMLRRVEPIFHVSIPLVQRLRPVPGVCVHRSKYLPDPALFPPGQLPVTSPADTVLDLALGEAAVNEDDLCGCITRGLTKGTSPESLRAALARRTRVRGRANIEILITEATEGTQSPLERRYDRDVERGHGLPRSSRQVPYSKSVGTTGYRDRYYEAYGVIVELDGRTDHPDDRRHVDVNRDNEAVASDDARTLRYGWRRVRWSPCETAAEVAKTLGKHGWTGRLRPCSPGCTASPGGSPR
jgi:hypothetical protein